MASPPTSLAPSPSFALIPDGVRLLIFELLTARDILNCSRVCRSWRRSIGTMKVLDAPDISVGMFRAILTNFPALTTLELSLERADGRRILRNPALDVSFTAFASAFRGISSLSSLRSLSLCWDRLHGSVFTDLEALPHLELLEIRLTVMYNADFAPSHVLFQRLKVLYITGLPFRDNLRLYFHERVGNYKKIGWNKEIPQKSEEELKRMRGMLNTRRENLIREFAMSQTYFVRVCQALEDNLAELHGSRILSTAQFKFLSLHLPALLTLGAAFLRAISACHLGSDSTHPAALVLAHKEFFQVVLARAKHCSRYENSALETKVHINEGDTQGPLKYLIKYPLDFLVLVADEARELYHATPIENEADISVCAVAADFLGTLKQGVEVCDSEFAMLRQLQAEEEPERCIVS